MANNKFENYVDDFYSDLVKYKKDYLTVFSDLQIQIEGWFRGELINYFKNMKKIELKTENREVLIPNQENKKRRKVDLKIPIENQDFWVELKHIIIGEQKGKPYDVDFYLKSYNPSNVISDIKKLTEVKSENKYVLCFISTNNQTIPNFSDLEKLKNLEKVKIKVTIRHKEYNDERKFGFFLLKVT